MAEYANKTQEFQQDLIKVLADDLETWDFVTERRQVHVRSKDYPDEALTTFRGDGLIARPTLEVLKYLIDETKRGEWDLFFQDGGMLEKINEEIGVVFYQTKSYWTTWPRDFTLLVHGTKLSESQVKELSIDLQGIEMSDENAPYLICAASIDYEKRAAPSSHVVGKVHRGGFLLVPKVCGDKIYTQATYVMQVDAAGWIPTSLANMVNTYQPLGIIGIRKALTGTSEPLP